MYTGPFDRLDGLHDRKNVGPLKKMIPSPHSEKMVAIRMCGDVGAVL